MCVASASASVVVVVVVVHDSSFLRCSLRPGHSNALHVPDSAADSDGRNHTFIMVNPEDYTMIAANMCRVITSVTDASGVKEDSPLFVNVTRRDAKTVRSPAPLGEPTTSTLPPVETLLMFMGSREPN